jgi:hypothetical protein
MRLTLLAPKLLRYVDFGRHLYVQTIAEADGLWFICPKCYESHGGFVGTHGIICWGPRVATDVMPGPGRWALQGDTLENISLGPAYPGANFSVQLNGACEWHGFVQNGEVTTCQ